MTAVKSRLRAVIDEDYPRADVILAHLAAIDPVVHPNAVASMVSQDIIDVDARFDVEGPICWRDPIAARRFDRERRRRAVAHRHVARVGR